MAETKEVKVEPHAIMSEEEFSDYQRRLILDGPKDPENFKLLDGRTLAEAQAAQREQDKVDREEADAFEKRSLQANTPKVEAVEVRVAPDGTTTASPASITPAPTQVPSAAEEMPTGRPQANNVLPPALQSEEGRE